jgi:CheY-like chemotaxis protein
MGNVRPSPRVLLVHDSISNDEHAKHLIDAGLQVADVGAETAVAKAIDFQPDIIVLDFSADGELTTQLKRHEATKHIPVIALVELSRP